MRINSRVVALGVLALCSFASCRDNKTKSLSEMKDEQTDAIETLQSSKSLKVVKRSDNTLPLSSLASNVYYRLKNGLYVRVLDKGDMSKLAKVNQTTVYLQMKGYMFSKSVSRTSVFDNLSKADIPELEFTYVNYYNQGEVHFTPKPSTAPVNSYDQYMCEGLAFPASQLGDGARVSLIIPFELGPSELYGSGMTTFVEEARYVYH